MSSTTSAGWLFLHVDAVPEPWRARGVHVVMVPLLPDEVPSLMSEAPLSEMGAPLKDRLVELTAGGFTVSAMARELGVTRRTVDRRLARLRAQYAVATTADLARLFSQRGFGLSHATSGCVAGSGAGIVE